MKNGSPRLVNSPSEVALVDPERHDFSWGSKIAQK